MKIDNKQLFADFWLIHEERIRKSLQSVPDEKMDMILETEKRFTKRILDKIIEWSAEDNVLIGWDVDDTMGDYRRDKNSKDYFIFRPEFESFMRFIKEKFPKINNGLLTARYEREVVESFEEGGHFYHMRDLFDENYRFAVAEEYQHSLSTEAIKIFGQRGSLITGMYKKMNAMAKVLEIHPEINYKLIDDYLPIDIEAGLGDSGLSVWGCFPRKSIDIIHQIYMSG